MKEHSAIFVGSPTSFILCENLNYGHTGKVQHESANWTNFHADGLPGVYRLRRKQVYIQAIDKTRHCPKP